MAENKIRNPIRHILVSLGYYTIRLYLSLITIRVLNEESFTTHIEKGGKAIAAIWHQRFFGVIGYAKKFSIFSPSAMISRSKDGDLIAQVAVRLGIRPVRGSSSRGGREALAAMVNDLTMNSVVFHAVDGPQGPKEVVKAGLIRMAQLSGAPIFPVFICPDRAWMVNSWDRFLIPKPFSRILVQWGSPIFVPREMDQTAFEGFRLQVEERMINGHAEGDRNFT